MSASKSVKKLLICGVALMTLASIGATSQSAISADTKPATQQMIPPTNTKQSTNQPQSNDKKVTVPTNNQTVRISVMPSSDNGDLMYIANGKPITDKNEINEIRQKAHISETNVLQHTASQRRSYFHYLYLAYYDYFAPYLPALPQRVMQPYQPGNLKSTMRITHSRKYGTSMEFEPSGVTVNQNGHAYVDGHYVGIIDPDLYLNQHLERYNINKNSYVDSMVFKSGKYSSAVRLGSIKGRDITIIIPRELQQRYNILVGRHVRHQMANMYNKEHQPDNAAIMIHGYNGGAFGARIRYWLKYYVNQAREQHHVQPLKYSPRVQAITNYRVIQATNVYNTESSYLRMLQQRFSNDTIDNWVHGKNLGQSFTNDAALFNLTTFNSFYDQAENAGTTAFGIIHERDLTYTHVLNNKTPREAAYSTVYNMIHHDNASHNGHAQNILRAGSTEGGFGIKLYRKHGQLVFTYLYDIC